jgi:fucose permease
VRLPEAVVVDPADHPGGLSSLPRAYWFTWGVLVCTIGIEFCLSLWASDLLTSRDGLSAGAATATWSGLLLGFAISRLVGGRLAVRTPVDTVLLAALATLVVGFALFWVARQPWVAVTGLFVTGLGLGVQYPLTIGRAIRAADGRSDLASARAGLAAGLAAGGGPFVLGALADRYGTHTAFLIVPVLIVLAVVGLLSSRTGSAQPA